MTNRLLFLTPLALALSAFTAAPALADTAPATPLNHYDIELDPTPYFASGYSGWVGFKPAALPNLRFVLGGFGLNLPSFLVSSGWTSRVSGYFVGSHYYFSNDRHGWYVGGYAGYMNATYGNKTVSGSASVNHVALMPAVGYQWFPFGSGFYIQPWIGLDVNVPLGSLPSIGTSTVPDPVVVPQPAIHLGWEF